MQYFSMVSEWHKNSSFSGKIIPDGKGCKGLTTLILQDTLSLQGLVSTGITFP
jgi:hypothetical protein